MLEEMQRLAGQIEAGYNRSDINWRERNRYMSDTGCCPIGAAFASLYPTLDVWAINANVRYDVKLGCMSFMADKLGISRALAHAVSSASEFYGLPASWLIAELKAGRFDVTAYPPLNEVHARWLF